MTGRPILCVGCLQLCAAGAVDASAMMTEPVQDTLYFAGEHTMSRAIGHGAWRLRSGFGPQHNCKMAPFRR